jgi:hypothetical protein
MESLVKHHIAFPTGTTKGLVQLHLPSLHTVQFPDPTGQFMQISELQDQPLEEAGGEFGSAFADAYTDDWRSWRQHHGRVGFD